ncbi:hypothetical protein JTE90_018730 [Oedothorax gibbosus]|uniref:Uncharacterized protein n=1 Tax=Oedothorax gibbosus TaxID=931172 RepID=A0AAV6UJ76_9ARAC|nr:hypothetical protein JTE90_018730 [Oedothorax gibbosus]
MSWRRALAIAALLSSGLLCGRRPRGTTGGEALTQGKNELVSAPLFFFGLLSGHGWVEPPSQVLALL